MAILGREALRHDPAIALVNTWPGAWRAFLLWRRAWNWWPPAPGWSRQAQPGGAMLAVRLTETEVQPLLRDQLSLAAVNSCSACVISGPYEAIEKLEGMLEKMGVAARRLQTSHAFHSAMMDPVIEPFT